MSERPLPQLQPQGLRNLRAYQLAKKLSHLTHSLTENFSKNEMRLVWQMREASISVFANIAEGYGRSSRGDYFRFCEIARGSLTELSSYFEFCQERNLLKPVEVPELFSLHNHTWNTLGALMRSLKSNNTDDHWNRTPGLIKEDPTVYLTEDEVLLSTSFHLTDLDSLENDNDPI